MLDIPRQTMKLLRKATHDRDQWTISDVLVAAEIAERVRLPKRRWTVYQTGYTDRDNVETIRKVRQQIAAQLWDTMPRTGKVADGIVEWYLAIEVPDDPIRTLQHRRSIVVELVNPFDPWVPWEYGNVVAVDTPAQIPTHWAASTIDLKRMKLLHG